MKEAVDNLLRAHPMLRFIADAAEVYFSKRVVLAHLSQENNRPELALEAARQALGALGLRSGEDVEVIAAPRNEPTGWFEV